MVIVLPCHLVIVANPGYRPALPLEEDLAGSELPQHTGVLLTRKQQVQPPSIMQDMHSQHAWSISQQ
jgi:hypothetical protein